MNIALYLLTGVFLVAGALLKDAEARRQATPLTAAFTVLVWPAFVVWLLFNKWEGGER
jgi:hypothetical protein